MSEHAALEIANVFRSNPQQALARAICMCRVHNIIPANLAYLSGISETRLRELLSSATQFQSDNEIQIFIDAVIETLFFNLNH